MEGTVGEDETEVGGELGDEGAGLEGEDLGCYAAAVEAENAGVVEGGGGWEGWVRGCCHCGCGMVGGEVVEVVGRGCTRVWWCCAVGLWKGRGLY